ncbi:hypothetical protein [Methylobacterium brachythecii]|uniref:Uncharacterized protein n=1 Tax=Methylobacterium brachythecii TaxID=1176177 RepID=A0A7W6F5L0_9HYPH|nr:hypothetical protein [Methylobacterium brachythecii]MBB3900996.1 hypothetical protein [Methylobacterium brachythecii]GLS45297.1 hypothetical protein GCM10007884_32860 [Methylobacterium brachythecii]
MSRQERLKSALRDNLKRRKEQARGRTQAADNGTEQAGEPKPPAEKGDGDRS